MIIWQRVGKLVYQLNEDGTNLFTARIEPGYERQNTCRPETIKKMADEKAEELAKQIQYAPAAYELLHEIANRSDTSPAIWLKIRELFKEVNQKP